MFIYQVIVVYVMFQQGKSETGRANLSIIREKPFKFPFLTFSPEHFPGHQDQGSGNLLQEGRVF